MVMRFVVLPLTLFTGTFFPLTLLPLWLQWIGWISPLWHGTELAREFAYGTPSRSGSPSSTSSTSCAVAVGWVWARRIAVRRLDK